MSSVVLYSASAFFFLTNNTSINIFDAQGQLTCASTSYTGQTITVNETGPIGARSSALSDEAAAAEDLARLTAQAIQAGLTPSEQISK